MNPLFIFFLLFLSLLSFTQTVALPGLPSSLFARDVAGHKNPVTTEYYDKYNCLIPDAAMPDNVMAPPKGNVKPFEWGFNQNDEPDPARMLYYPVWKQWTEDHRTFFNEGMDYLSAMTPDTDCGVGKGKNLCSRVACSYGEAIWLCNDSDEKEVHVPCNLVGLYAKFIALGCGFIDANPFLPDRYRNESYRYSGVKQDPTGWFVSVERDYDGRHNRHLAGC
ncbi:hypothetical protein MMC25_001184 [Agyrium rufum]|nr:hypothetical protein [Agyrium rufum]